MDGSAARLRVRLGRMWDGASHWPVDVRSPRFTWPGFWRQRRCDSDLDRGVELDWVFTAHLDGGVRGERVFTTYPDSGVRVSLGRLA